MKHLIANHQPVFYHYINTFGITALQRLGAYWQIYGDTDGKPEKIKGAVCGFGEEIQNDNCNIYSINEVILQTHYSK